MSVLVIALCSTLLLSGCGAGKHSGASNDSLGEITGEAGGQAEGQAENAGETPSQSRTEEAAPTEGAGNTSEPSDIEALKRPNPLYENGAFNFSAAQFRERFADTLPEGFAFAATLAANPDRGGRLQLDILDAAGTPVDLAVVINETDEDIPCRQMALVIGKESFAEDQEILLSWYLTSFLYNFETEEQETICLEYLNVLDRQITDFKVHARDELVTMMSRESEGENIYYYALISVQ